MMPRTTQQISLPKAAQLLHESYNQAYRRVMLGQLAGEQRGRLWYVNMGDVQRVLRDRQSPADNAA
ncbi:MAG TPA: hypothetical protein VF102_01335 [Gemmatimonadaceae bacterium]